MDGPQGALDAELASYPAELIGEAKYRAGVGDRDAQSLTTEEKVCPCSLTLFMIARSCAFCHAAKHNTSRDAAKAESTTK
jgi:hypothetical protein